MSRILAVCLILLAAAACEDEKVTGGGDPLVPRMAVLAVTPANGTTTVIPEAYPYHELGGVVLRPGSGILSVDLELTTAEAQPFGKLNVYLLRNGSPNDSCGQNLPDSPTWDPLPAHWTNRVTITGFQVTKLPCDVTGVRAVLHVRSNLHLNTLPTPDETIVEATAPVSFRLSR